MIIRGGHNIDPSMIEEAMMAHPVVQLAAAVGKPDAYAGELPVVYVTLQPGCSATTEELQAHAKASIPERAAVPSEVLIRDALPITAVGKIFKPELRFDATRRALEAALQKIGGDAVTFLVSVATDAKHGTFAQVEATEVSPGARGGVESKAREALDGFSVRYEFTWRAANSSSTAETT